MISVRKTNALVNKTDNYVSGILSLVIFVLN